MFISFQNLLQPRITINNKLDSPQKKQKETNYLKHMAYNHSNGRTASFINSIYYIPFKGNDLCENNSLEKELPIDKYIRNAKRFLIDDVKEKGWSSANGICFYGPDSLGKESLIEGFIQDLSGANYKIERMPRAKDVSIQELETRISKAIEEAENNYKTTNQRTAIIVRDLDSIAKDRKIAPTNTVAGALLNVDGCGDRGFAWIAEAKNFDEIEPALMRRGRLDHFIPSKPSKEDRKEIWEAYIESVNEYAADNDKQALINDAMSILKQ